LQPLGLDDDQVDVSNAPTWVTPPYVNAIKDTFNSSMNFDNEENPWL